MSATIVPPPSDDSGRWSARPAAGNGGATGFTLLRVGLGVIWALNLVFILDPANGFFSSFASTAQSFAPTSLGGPGLAQFVAANTGPFSVAIAATTAYLAVAFLLGATTRIACVVGFVFNSVLLVTQIGSVVVIPGGTDVGPMPLYLVIYLTIAVTATPTMFSLDAWWADRRISTPAAHSPAAAGDGA